MSGPIILLWCFVRVEGLLRVHVLLGLSYEWLCVYTVQALLSSVCVRVCLVRAL